MYFRILKGAIEQQQVFLSGMLSLTSFEIPGGVKVQHIALMGDSIFDNRSYVGSDPDVVTHLRKLLPAGWAATLCAIDGSTSKMIVAQMTRIPKDATYIVVSVGGNDALKHQNLLSNESGNGPSILVELAYAASVFTDNYREALIKLKTLGKPITVCTIYNGNLPDTIGVAARAAVAVFNDKIYMVANELSLSVLELRGICIETSDYANPIEPSGKGGAKIARAIVRHVQERMKP
jgi:lysophospholipase L1-like esterase